MLLKMIFVWCNMIMTLDLQTSRSLYTLWSKACMSQIGEYLLRTIICHIILLWPSHVTLKLGSRSLPTLSLKAPFIWNMTKIGLIGKYICSEKKILHSPIWPWFSTQKRYSKFLCTPFDHRHSESEEWARLVQGEKQEFDI